jgi:hypothetical protein
MSAIISTSLTHSAHFQRAAHGLAAGAKRTDGERIRRAVFDPEILRMLKAFYDLYCSKE